MYRCIKSIISIVYLKYNRIGRDNEKTTKFMTVCLWNSGYNYFYMVHFIDKMLKDFLIVFHLLKVK